jgi:nucleotide-binding universal stress UspA family protein
VFSKILVPIDFSEYTPEILAYATEIAEKFQSAIHLIHVIPKMDHFGAYEPFAAVANIIAVQKSLQSEVEKDLAELAKGITGIPVTKAIRRGVSFVEIVDYARTEGIDLVVMSTHGRGGLNLIIGSAAEKVVRKSPCPVLTIRPLKKQVEDV